MASGEVDLVNVFQSITQALGENQQNLDSVDGYNGDHGTNMVQTFQTITQALQKKQKVSDSAALSYAAKQLSKQAVSGSAKVYAQNLSVAAEQFKGKKVDSRGALDLLQTLIGGGQPALAQDQPAGGGGDILGALLGGLGGGVQPTQAGGGSDLLGSLLGGLGGGAQQTQAGGGADLLGSLLGGLGGGAQQPEPSASGGGDLLGSLLGGLGGGQSSGGGGDMIGTLLGSLLGGGGLQSLVQTFLGGSRMGDSAHRTQSTELVVQSFLQSLASQNK